LSAGSVRWIPLPTDKLAKRKPQESGETDEWDACGLCVVGGYFLRCRGRARPAAASRCPFRPGSRGTGSRCGPGRRCPGRRSASSSSWASARSGSSPGRPGRRGGVGVVPAELCEVGHAHRDAVTQTGDSAPVGPVGVGVVLADLDHLAHPVLRPCRRGQGQDEQGCCQGSGHCLPLCLRSSVHRPLARPAGLPAHGTSCQCWRYSPRPCRRLVRPGSGVSDLRAWQFDGPRGGLCGPEGPPEGAAGAKAARWTSFALAPVLVGRYGPGLRSGRAGSVGPSEVN